MCNEETYSLRSVAWWRLPTAGSRPISVFISSSLGRGSSRRRLLLCTVLEHQPKTKLRVLIKSRHSQFKENKNINTKFNFPIYGDQWGEFLFWHQGLDSPFPIHELIILINQAHQVLEQLQYKMQKINVRSHHRTAYYYNQIKEENSVPTWLRALKKLRACVSCPQTTS